MISKFDRIIIICIILVLLVREGFININPKESLETEQPVQGVDLPVINKLEAKVAIFTTDAFLPKKDNSIVEFPFKWFGETGEMWLSVKVIPDVNPIVILVDHPVINDLSEWVYIFDEKYTLFQRVNTYVSVTDFLNNPPYKEGVLADPQVISEHKSLQRLNVYSLVDWQNTNFEYFITTYHKPQVKNNYSLFSSKIDLTNAEISDCPNQEICKTQITWKLDVPNASSINPWGLGMIHLNQRQW